VPNNNINILTQVKYNLNQDDWDNFSESSDEGYKSNSPKRSRTPSRSPPRDRGDRGRYNGGGGGWGGQRRGGGGGNFRERRPPRNISKGRIMEQAQENAPRDTWWLNLFEVDRNASLEDIT
jgi:hypothetical protein